MGLMNTTHKNIVQSMVNLQADLIKNPYYLFNDKKATIVDYYNLNTTRSTLDEALKIPYSNLGKDSPLRFNLINEFYLYGIDRISTELDMGDFGIESSDITGEAYILPNTIIPYPGDYFEIKHISERKYLFKVTAITRDTFDNGANYWRISYRLDQISDEKLLPLVVDEFQFSTGTVGTNFASVVKKTSWDLATALDNVAVMLKQYYKSLYYNNKVQTFTFVHLYQLCQNRQSSSFFYDPYLIEFMIRNKVLDNDGNEFMFIDHKTILKPEFRIRYTKTIWDVFEKRDISRIGSCRYISQADYINDPATIFQSRYEDYFEMNYQNEPIYMVNQNPVEVLPSTIIYHIEHNQLFDYGDEFEKYNIFVKYMNGIDFDIRDIVPYENIEDTDMDEINFFAIPLAIFCIERYIEKLLSKT